MTDPDAVGEPQVVLGGLTGELGYADTDFDGLDPEIQAMFGIADTSAS